jgi:hypothetical protein
VPAAVVTRTCSRLAHGGLEPRSPDRSWLPIWRVSEALVIPLGKVAARAVEFTGVDPSRVLWELPHPSGANGHRAAQYAQARKTLTQTVAAWFGWLHGRSADTNLQLSITRQRAGVGVGRSARKLPGRGGCGFGLGGCRPRPFGRLDDQTDDQGAFDSVSLDAPIQVSTS